MVLVPIILDQLVDSGQCSEHYASYLYFPENFLVPIFGLGQLGSSGQFIKNAPKGNITSRQMEGHSVLATALLMLHKKKGQVTGKITWSIHAMGILSNHQPGPLERSSFSFPHYSFM